jgi:hypothetical protein
MPASLMKRQLVDERRQQAWTWYCQGMPIWQIGKRLGVSTASAQQYVAHVRKKHPAQEISEGDKFVEGYETMREVGLILRSEIAKARENGDPVQPLLATLSTHSDRFARFITRASAVPNVEINATACLDHSAVAHLLGRAPGGAMQSAAVEVQSLPEA